jgi:hypothetical protein
MTTKTPSLPRSRRENSGAGGDEPARWSQVRGLTRQGLLVALLVVVAMAGFAAARMLASSSDLHQAVICSETCAPNQITALRATPLPRRLLHTNADPTPSPQSQREELP